MQSQSMLKPPEKHGNFLQTLRQILLVCRKYLHPCLLSEIQKGKKKSKNEFDDSDINYDDYHHNDASDDDCAYNDLAKGSDDSTFQGLTVTTDEGGKVTILNSIFFPLQRICGKMITAVGYILYVLHLKWGN